MAMSDDLKARLAARKKQNREDTVLKAQDQARFLAAVDYGLENLAPVAVWGRTRWRADRADGTAYAWGRLQFASDDQLRALARAVDHRWVRLSFFDRTLNEKSWYAGRAYPAGMLLAVLRFLNLDPHKYLVLMTEEYATRFRVTPEWAAGCTSEPLA